MKFDPNTQLDLVAYTGDGRVQRLKPIRVTYGDIFRGSKESRGAVAAKARNEFLAFDLYHSEMVPEYPFVTPKRWWTFETGARAIAHALWFLRGGV